jgi:uncharacterized membrane protein (DUF485 family)
VTNAPIDSPELQRRTSRIALALFWVYLAAYAGFMGLATFAPQWMERPAVWGVNLAILYGLGLIVGAVVLALLYMLLCHRSAARLHAENRRP